MSRLEWLEADGLGGFACGICRFRFFRTQGLGGSSRLSNNALGWDCGRWRPMALLRGPVLGGFREQDGAYHQGTVWPCLRARLLKLGSGCMATRRPQGRRCEGSISSPCLTISTRRDSATSLKLPAPYRTICPEDVPFGPGSSVKFFGYRCAC